MSCDLKLNYEWDWMKKSLFQVMIEGGDFYNGYEMVLFEEVDILGAGASMVL